MGERECGDVGGDLLLVIDSMCEIMVGTSLLIWEVIQCSITMIAKTVRNGIVNVYSQTVTLRNSLFLQ
jgi:hypothetical protein